MREGLAIELLCGGYGKLSVFRDVSFTVAPGETIGIFGPNGAGKTTLFSTIVGLLPPLSGRVSLDGEDLSHLPAYQRARRKLALVPEGRQVLSTLTVLDNMQLTKTASNEADGFSERLTQVFELFPRLQERQSQFAGTLSGGEQQMLAIARALLIKPKVLMLDEPTQGLAPVIVQELLVSLRKLKGQFSMIVVEQNKKFLEGLSDRMLPMSGGKLQ